MGFLDMLFAGSHKISPQEAFALMKRSDVTVLDVRSPGEFASGHIKQAHNIPIDQLGMRASRELPDKGAKILVYCLSGARASSAVKLLQDRGYQDVTSFGGINSWPHELVR
jgi:rhodanese-related sulfurtransferase